MRDTGDPLLDGPVAGPARGRRQRPPRRVRQRAVPQRRGLTSRGPSRSRTWRTGGDRLVAERQRASDERGGAVGVAGAVEAGHGLAGGHALPERHEQLDPGAGVDRVLLVPAARAQGQRGARDAVGVEPGDVPVPRGRHLAHVAGDREVLERRGVAALRPHERDELLVRGARGQRAVDGAARVVDAAELQERLRDVARHAREVVAGRLAAEEGDALADLQGVADGAPERGVHVGDERGGADPHRLAEPHEESASSCASAVVFMKAPEPRLTS